LIFLKSSISHKLTKGPLCRHGGFEYNEKLYLFGGKSHSLITTNRLFYYEIGTNNWVFQDIQGFIPPPTESFSYLYDKDLKTLMIFGGFNSMTGEFNNSMYEFDLKSSFWREIIYKSERNPGPRAGHAWTSIIPDKIYMFGGEISDKKLKDLWLFDRKKELWLEITINQTSSIWPCVFSLFFTYKKLVFSKRKGLECQ
jgi:hypothetical protein